MHDEGRAGDMSLQGHSRLLALTPSSSLPDVVDACRVRSDDDDDAYQNCFSNPSATLQVATFGAGTDRGVRACELRSVQGCPGRCAHTGGMPASPKDNWEGINKGIHTLFSP